MLEPEWCVIQIRDFDVPRRALRERTVRRGYCQEVRGCTRWTGRWGVMWIELVMVRETRQGQLRRGNLLVLEEISERVLGPVGGRKDVLRRRSYQRKHHPWLLPLLLLFLSFLHVDLANFSSHTNWRVRMMY